MPRHKMSPTRQKRISAKKTHTSKKTQTEKALYIAA
jgi:hypothetical protein